VKYILSGIYVGVLCVPLAYAVVIGVRVLFAGFPS
jgi:hypothetical protein